MNRFRQHIPSFIDVERPEWIEFETTEDLLSIDVVKQWVKTMDGKPFSHFAVSGNYLMAIHDDSFHWWAVGYIDKPDAVDLPKWHGGKYRAELSDGKKTVLNDEEVVSICGDVLTLRDGTKAKRIKEDVCVNAWKKLNLLRKNTRN